MHVKYTLVGVACLLVTAHAFADAKTECIAAADNGQSARDDGKYRAAREAFATCARDVCPKPVAASCTKWSREIEEAMPSLVVSAKDSSGNDISAVRVMMDGALLVATLDGKPINVDPGAHKLHFDHDGSEAADQNVVVKAGEKLRAINVTFRSSTTTTTTHTDAAPKIEESKSGGNTARNATTIVLGVFAVGGIAAGIGMGFLSQSDANNAAAIRATMSSNACVGVSTSAACQNLSSTVDSQNRDAALSVALYVTGGVLAAAAIMAWIAWPKSHTESVSVIVGPTFAGLRGTF